MAKVLVVDDEEYMRVMMEDFLEEAGHEIRTAGDGLEAEAVMGGWEPDLVITDILMPNEGGLNLIQWVRDRFPTLPVIAVSGGGKDGKLNFLKTAETFRNVRSLDKPFRYRDLLDAVQTALS